MYRGSGQQTQRPILGPGAPDPPACILFGFRGWEHVLRISVFDPRVHWGLGIWGVGIRACVWGLGIQIHNLGVKISEVLREGGGEAARRKLAASARHMRTCTHAQARMRIHLRSRSMCGPARPHHTPPSRPYSPFNLLAVSCPQSLSHLH